jgi:hypothetical protein
MNRSEQVCTLDLRGGKSMVDQLRPPRRSNCSAPLKNKVNSTNVRYKAVKYTCRGPSGWAPRRHGCELEKPSRVHTQMGSYGPPSRHRLLCLCAATAVAPEQQTSSTPACHASLEEAPVSIKELIMRTPSYMRLKHEIHKKVRLGKSILAHFCAWGRERAHQH